MFAPGAYHIVTLQIKSFILLAADTICDMYLSDANLLSTN